MEMSHIADDFAAIARRLNEILEENRTAEERAALPPRRSDMYQFDRTPQRGTGASQVRRH
jgi:hypothetical protein